MRPRFWAPFLLGVVAFGTVAGTVRAPGLTWDESIYFGFSHRYWLLAQEWGRQDWHDLSEMTDEIRHKFRDVPRPWGVFSPPVVYFFWRQGQVHPPLAPLCYAAGLHVFSRFTDILPAFRLPAVLMFTGLVLMTYFFFSSAGREDAAEEKTAVGAIAAVSLLLMPRVFGHAHFAALDMPAAFMWMATVLAFRKGMQSTGGAVAGGVVFGLALLTKINAALLPLALWPWALMAHGRKGIKAIVSMLVLGPIVFVAGWPWMWRGTFANVWAYLADKVSRLHIPVHYLGTTYDQSSPPWHYPFVLTAVTLPLGALAAVVAGLWLSAKRFRRDPLWSLAAANLVVIYGVAAFPGVPKYDGVRLFLPAFPFLAGLAGLALARLGRSVWERRPWGPRAVCGGAVALGAAALWGVLSYHPYELSYYNGLAGGLRGAHRLGFETTYWGDVFDRRAMQAVNELCARGASVCVYPLEIRAPRLRQALGDLRRDLKFVTESEPHDYLVLLAREGFFAAREWALYRQALHADGPSGGARLLWVSRLKGVPLCMVFEMEKAADRPR